MSTEYPMRLAAPSLLGEDRTVYHQRLMDESARLFKTASEFDIEVLRLHQGPQGKQQEWPGAKSQIVGGVSQHFPPVIESIMINSVQRIWTFLKVRFRE